MNSVPIVSTWLVGIINGCGSHLDNNIKYGTMGLSSAVLSLKILLETEPITRVNSLMAATISGPVIVGTVFCLGSYVGRAMKYTKEVKLNEEQYMR